MISRPQTDARPEGRVSVYLFRGHRWENVHGYRRTGPVLFPADRLGPNGDLFTSAASRTGFQLPAFPVLTPVTDHKLVARISIKGIGVSAEK